GRHAEYCLALAEEADPRMRGAEQASWLERLEREHDNLRAALGWTRSSGDAETDLRLNAALWEFFLWHGHLSEGQRWLEAALARRDAVSVGVRARALNA